MTIDSVRNHCRRHFPVQNVGRAAYPEILERRARENALDFVNGVATAITPMAVLETIMVKGYETLVDEGTTVNCRDGEEEFNTSLYGTMMLVRGRSCIRLVRLAVFDSG